MGGVQTNWALIITNPSHNHDPIIAGSHPLLQKIAMTDEVQNTVINHSRAGAKPQAIISSLRLDHDKEDPILKHRNVYNIKAKARSKALGSLTPIQTLLCQLDIQEDWFMRQEANVATQRLEYLFFVWKSSQLILELNCEVLILDATYKTNKYKLPLLVITGVTALNTSFYLGFAFMKAEYTSDYTWVMGQVRALYDRLGLQYPSVVLTDHQPALMNACRIVFPDSKRMLCIWYFDEQEVFDAFRKAFCEIRYAATEEAYEHAWEALQSKYTKRYPLAIAYVSDNIIPQKKKFVAFWTNQHLHFNNWATSRGESNNGKLKRQLGGSSIGTGLNQCGPYVANPSVVGDLKTVVDAIDVMLTNERQSYQIAINEARIRLPIHVKKPIFRDLCGKVSPFALKQMLPHYLKVVNHTMKPCTKFFTTTMGLSCANIMEQHMADGAGVLRLDGIHSHW